MGTTTIIIMAIQNPIPMVTGNQKEVGGNQADTTKAVIMIMTATIVEMTVANRDRIAKV
jgi:hypothetical protein